MNAPAIPLLVCAIGDVTVRWYDRRDADGLDDWPWLALGDVLRLTGFSHATQVEIAGFPALDGMNILTRDGPELIIPPWSAYGTLQAAINLSVIHESVLDLTKQGTRIALALILAEIEPKGWAAWFDAIDARPVTGEEAA